MCSKGAIPGHLAGHPIACRCAIHGYHFPGKPSVDHAMDDATQ